MKVLIVGAGPTGMALALALKQRGIGYRLVEKLPARAPHSRALAVQARTIEVFEKLGIADRLLAEAVAVEGATLHDGGTLRRFDFTHVHPRLPSAVILPQDETERLLEEAAPSVERGIEFLGLVEGGAKLCLQDGSEEIAHADWIVGCDGAHSAVRHALGTGFPGEQYAAKLALADCRIGELHDARVHLWTSTDRPVIAFPLPHDRWRLITFMPGDAPDPPENSLEPFVGAGLTLSDLVWWSRFRISERQVPSMRVGRVLLAGDAAHIHSPAGGQGMNLGIQDAWALARALSEGEAAVDAWAAERHAIAAKVIALTDRATRMMMTQSSLVIRYRARVIAALMGQPWIERRVETAFAGLNYPAIT